MPGSSASNEIDAKPKRRQYSNAFKLRILEQVDACETPGATGALLRREGLYSSHLSNWRRLRDAGALTEAQAPRRGPKPTVANPLQTEVDRLTRTNARLEAELEQARAIIDVQKKVAEIFAALPRAVPRDGARS